MAAGLRVMEHPEAGKELLSESAKKYNPGLLPFWHFECGVGQGEIALTSWLSIVLSQFCLLFLIFKIVASTAHAWDYSVTISFVHFVITCAATRAFPVSWVWWVTVLLSTLAVSIASELMCYFLHDLRDIEKT